MEDVGLVGQLVFMCDDNNSFAIQVVFGYHFSQFDGLRDEVGICNVGISMSAHCVE